MIQDATITSKMQFTIPMSIAKKVGVSTGDKVTVSVEEGRIILTPIKQVLAELSGVLSLPDVWKGKDLDSIINESKTKHFQDKKI